MNDLSDFLETAILGVMIQHEEPIPSHVFVAAAEKAVAEWLRTIANTITGG